jgi:DNA-binding transcriptional LysR family regulator
MVDPQGLLLLSALAKSGGVRKAAAILGVPRSTISRRLAQLEASAGAPLVVRTARRFALTELGAALAERAASLETVLEESEDLIRRSKAEPAGTLRIAVAPVLGEEVLPEILAELARVHPRLTIDARLSVEYVDLRRGDVDVALRASALDDATDVFAVRIGTSTSGCFASPKYLRDRGTPKSPAELASHDCILVSARTEWKLRDRTVRVSGRLRVDNFRVARDLAARGAGIVWVAKSFADAMVDAGELVPILERHWSTTPIFAVHAGGSPPPPKVRAFIDLAKRVVGREFPG